MCSSPRVTLGRIGVLGDVHAEDERLAEALAHFAGRDLDAVLCVGDIVDGPGDVARTIALLRDHDVICVAGNHERWFLTGSARDLPDATQAVPDDLRAFLGALPPTRRLETVAGGALLCHAVGEDDMSFLRSDTRGYALQAMMDELRPLMLDPECAFMIAGHTHERMVRTFEGLVVLNAGTLHRRDQPGVLEVDFGAREAIFFDLLDEGVGEASRHAF